jgi:hypothetical protein
MEPAHYSPNGLPRRLYQGEVQTHALRGRQDNPAQPRARAASPQPAPLKNKMRPPPFEEYKNDTHPGRPAGGKRRHTTTHLKPRVRAGIERIAEEKELSVSATLAAIAEWFLTLTVFEQNISTMDSAIDKGIGRHMKVHSDREASLLARLIQKVELLIQIDTQILSRQQGVDGRKLEELMQKADELARASITRTTASEKKVIDTEKAAFEKGGTSSAYNGNF